MRFRAILLSSILFVIWAVSMLNARVVRIEIASHSDILKQHWILEEDRPALIDRGAQEWDEATK